MDYLRHINKNCITLLLVLCWLSGTECTGCFDDKQKINKLSVPSGSSVFQRCECSLPGHSAKDLKWIDAHGVQIEELGLRPGTKKDYYTEIDNNGLNLQIPNINKNVSGLYKCVTVYNGKEYTITYDVVAYDHGIFMSPNKEQYITKGTQGFITCKIISDNLSDIIPIWSIGPDFIKIENNAKYEVKQDGLIVKNVEDTDSNIYNCSEIVLETGEISELLINVKVVTMPVIERLEVIPNKTVIAGESLAIECKASGDPQPTYKWNKISNTNTIEQKNVSWIQHNDTIIFDTVTPDDQGTYECIASNKAGETKKEIKVEVLYGPIITKLENMSIAEGFTAHITCTAKGNPRPVVHIIYTSSNKVNNNPTLKTTNLNESEAICSYTINKVEPSDAGIYTCNASNEVDFVTGDIYLNVLHKPYFRTPYEFIWGWPDKSINLTCDEQSYPQASLTWSYQHEGIPLTNNFNIIPKSNLISEVNKNQDKIIPLLILPNNSYYGVYICTAKNNYGEATKTIRLKEGLVPELIKNVTPITLTATSITFDIEGPDEEKQKSIGPEVQGFTAQYEIADRFYTNKIYGNSRTWSNDRTYTITKLKPNTTYIFRFAAANLVGIGPWSEEKMFTTPEKSQPERPMWGNPPVENVSGSQVLRWITPEENGDPIDYYIIRYCPMSFGEILQKLCIEEKLDAKNEKDLNFLEVNTTYHIELFAHNSVGNSIPVDTYVTRQNINGTVTLPRTNLSAGAVIGIALLIVLLCLIALDLLMLFWKRKGVLAKCCLKKKKTKDKLNTKDRKGLLKDEEPAKKPDNGHKEFEYNKNTGAITGKHSAV